MVDFGVLISGLTSTWQWVVNQIAVYKLLLSVAGVRPQRESV